jgi:uncharacterized protein
MTDEPQDQNTTTDTPSGKPPKDACTMAMLTHLLAFCGLTGIPFANILWPLVLWLVKKDSHPFIDDQGKESLNFQITAMIGVVALGVLSIIPFAICLTLPLLAALGITVIVFVIIASIKTSDGVAYRYPLSLRLIK